MFCSQVNIVKLIAGDDFLHCPLRLVQVRERVSIVYARKKRLDQLVGLNTGLLCFCIMLGVGWRWSPGGLWWSMFVAVGILKTTCGPFAGLQGCIVCWRKVVESPFSRTTKGEVLGGSADLQLFNLWRFPFRHIGVSLAIIIHFGWGFSRT